MLAMDYLDGLRLSELSEQKGLSERQKKAAARRILTRLSEVREGARATVMLVRELGWRGRSSGGSGAETHLALPKYPPIQRGRTRTREGWLGYCEGQASERRPRRQCVLDVSH
jgi:hypothetical protein